MGDELLITATYCLMGSRRDEAHFSATKLNAAIILTPIISSAISREPERRRRADEILDSGKTSPTSRDARVEASPRIFRVSVAFGGLRYRQLHCCHCFRHDSPGDAPDNLVLLSQAFRP